MHVLAMATFGWVIWIDNKWAFSLAEYGPVKRSWRSAVKPERFIDHNSGRQKKT